MKIDPQRLPHWSRVAFVARCARRVQPLFLNAWPEAPVPVREDVDRAIVLAERSAIERAACEGLKQAEMRATMAAGRALMPYLYDLYAVPINDSEHNAASKEKSLIAGFAAKTAEKAALCARTPTNESAQIALEGFSFACDTIEAAGQFGMYELIEADFVSLLRAKKPKRPWWRFW